MGIAAIQIDQREPAWAQQLTFGGVPTIVTLLPAGDYLVATDDGCLLGIERKTASDFLNTLRDDRLFPQLQRLHETTPWAYLAVTGDLRCGPDGKTWADGRETGWQWSSVDGAMLSVQEMGINILHVASDYDLEAAIVRLANRSRQPMRLSPIRDVVMVSEGEGILAALPGIGPDRAATLMEYHDTPAQALSYLTLPRHYDPMGELTDVPGIKEGIQFQVRRALGLTQLNMWLRLEPLPEKERE